ncbi:hypothetical protein HK405_001592, partial [Cladochytrium tenue]
MIRRTIASASGRPRLAPADVGVAFDIDGVLMHGRRAIPQAASALRLLGELRVPYILLTNGGGTTEEAKAAKLSAALDTHLSPEQIVLAHSPMVELVPQFGDKQVLILGRDSCRDAAEAYGFRRTVLAEEVLAWRKDIWAFREPAGSVRPPANIDLDNEPISA